MNLLVLAKQFIWSNKNYESPVRAHFWLLKKDIFILMTVLIIIKRAAIRQPVYDEELRLSF
jgi:hypothetical protein